MSLSESINKWWNKTWFRVFMVIVLCLAALGMALRIPIAMGYLKVGTGQATNK